MAKQDLKERAYQFAVDLLKFIDTLESKNTTNQIIAKQLIRSATSIGANIIEA